MGSKIPTIALCQSGFVAFTGLVAFFKPETFLNLYGLKPIAKTPSALIIAPAFGARNTALGLTAVIFHQQGNYKAMAVGMLCLILAGAMDTVVTFQQKQYGGAAFHAGGSCLLAYLGLNMLDG